MEFEYDSIKNIYIYVKGCEKFLQQNLISGKFAERQRRKVNGLRSVMTMTA